MYNLCMELKTVTYKNRVFLVSAYGHIHMQAEDRNFLRMGKPRVWRSKARQLKPWLGKNGYLYVSRQDGRENIKALVHRLVAMAWVTGYSDGLSVNHIDGNKLNNCASNLEWITLAENTAHQWQIGLVNLKGEKHPLAKLTDAEAAEIYRQRQLGVHVLELAQRFNVSTALVYKIAKGTKRPNASI